jgi:hypothetical protein
MTQCVINCKEMGVQLDKEQWYEHVTKLLVAGHEGKATILWNKQVPTDRNLPSNKPDIIIWNNEKRTCMTIHLQFQQI